MKTRIPKRVYTEQFRDAAVRQVIEAGRSVIEVARSLEISEKTLGNWVRQVRCGEHPVNQAAAMRVDEAQVELARLRAENARLKVDNEILKRAAAYFAKESR
ncbi:transposase [Aromatoleum diolicum]|uniref:Transposase n=1 Tax=Aromatoleum diolicum TaxID=75796 RepID=A0ABX1QJ38_9RHOO|nr:transposase [Aromatoleum diolicum]NMG77309.1 transposase [Aromatoleum diolicum]